jgi:hypothetical protein
MMGILQKDRYLMASWKKPDRSPLKDNIIQVGIMASASRRDTGFISVEYYLSNGDACNAELSEAEDEAL